MAGQPSAGELVAAVREFLAGLTRATGDAPPVLEGRDAFHATVAANALAIVERELAADADAVEVAALLHFTSSPRRKPGLGFESASEAGMTVGGGGEPSAAEKPSPGFRRGDDDGAEQRPRSAIRRTDAEVHDLRSLLSAAIRDRALTAATPSLLDALIVATIARLNIDNPRYPTLARLAPAPPASPNAAVRR